MIDTNLSLGIAIKNGKITFSGVNIYKYKARMMVLAGSIQKCLDFWVESTFIILLFENTLVICEINNKLI